MRNCVRSPRTIKNRDSGAPGVSLVDEITLEDIRKRMVQSIYDFYRRDGELLGVLDANERSITHKLAEHMKGQFSGWQVDCEYNRRESGPKRLKGTLVLPDIIVHRRGIPENLLVIECKKENEVGLSKDEKKIESFVNDTHYKCRFGLVLVFGSKECIRANLFQDGKQSEDWKPVFNARLKELAYGK